jgi:hypothetical protein
MIPEQLEMTPGMIRPLLAGLTPDQIVWKPAPDRFSIAEVLAHLAHAEHHAYTPKYEQFAAEADSALEPYDTDGLVARGEYSGRDVIESLEDFEKQRKENLALLRGIKDRTLHHKKVGPISLSDLLNECAYHDLGHIRQIAELVRALKYYPKMGLYAKFYKVNP